MVAIRKELMGFQGLGKLWGGGEAEDTRGQLVDGWLLSQRGCCTGLPVLLGVFGSYSKCFLS